MERDHNYSEFSLVATLDPEVVKSTLSSPLCLDVVNIRDFGAGSALFLFRSGEPSRITPKGIGQLEAYAITNGFDLRAEVEMKRHNSGTPTVEGVEFVRAVMLAEALDPVAIAKQLKVFSDDEADAFKNCIPSILNTVGPVLEQVLVYLRDHTDQPCLIHCTDIINDYALTSVGLQTVLPVLPQRFQKEVVFRNNWRDALSLGTAKPESLQGALNVIEREFGGIDAYVGQHTSLGDGRP
ncbi:hypothetical protein V8D89_009839 [Ganoderma adspersum]